MIVHNIDDKSSLSHFSGDSKHSVIMWCDSWIFAILADFLKMDWEQFWKKLCNLIVVICSVTNFLK